MKDEMEKHFRKEVLRLRNLIRKGEADPKKVIQNSIFLTEEEKRKLLEEFQEEQETLKREERLEIIRKMENILQETKKVGRVGTYMAILSIVLALYLEFRGDIPESFWNLDKIDLDIKPLVKDIINEIQTRLK